MGIADAEYGPAAEQLAGERLEPAKHQRHLSTPTHGWPCPLDQVRRSLEVLGGKRMADRIGRKTIVLVPFARAPMQGRYQIGPLRHQMRVENVCEEVMIAIPVALVVQRNDEEVAPL